MNHFIRGFSFCVLSVLLLILGLGAGGCRPIAPSTGFPSDWLTTTDRQSPELSPLSRETESRLGSSFGQIVDTHQEVLEGLRSEPVDFFRDTIHCAQPWHLSGYIADFGVTLSGIIGVLVGAGTAAGQVVWRNRDSNPAAPPSEPGILSQQIEPAIRAALATGIIRDEPSLRTHLTESARNFQILARSLDSLSLRHSQWRANSFRLELQFDASGRPLPWVQVGATVTFRFDWKKSEKPSSEFLGSRMGSAPLSPPQDRMSERLQGFVTALSRDLDVLENDAYGMELNGFTLNAIRTAVGITTGGDFGFAQASTHMKGSLLFEKVPDSHETLGFTGADSTTDADKIDQEETVDLITDAALELRPEIKEAGIVFHPLRALEPFRRIVKIRRSALRAGLRRAQRISTFFVRHTPRGGTGRWELHEVSNEFDMSLNGIFGIVTIGNVGELELIYAKASR
ncbi:hypothetical protein WDW37_00015 [Bdellovibrionota bacterium FG-1]